MLELPTENPDSSKRWYVGHTLVRKEALAQAHLERQGFESFLPRIAATRRHARKCEQVKFALFPRYLFVRLDLGQDRWRSVNGTLGMAYLLTVNDTPCPVAAGFVEALKDSVGDDGLIALAPKIRPGDSVRVVSGPFAEKIGELVRLDSQGRVELLLHFMTGIVRVKMARGLLEVASKR